MRTEILEEFVVCAKHANFHRAAVELNTTQPALSKHIQALEKELGFQLFDRSGGAVRLSVKGTRFLACAQEALAVLRGGIKECRTCSEAVSPVRLQWIEQDEGSRDLLRAADGIPLTLVGIAPMATLLVGFEENLADVVLSYDVPSITGSEGLICGKGLSSLSIGPAKGAVMAMRGKLPDRNGSLCSNDLRRAKVMIPFDGASSDQMAGVMTDILGDDLDLEFVLRPDLANPTAFSYMDFGPCIYFGYAAYLRRICANRDDVVFHDELDGRELLIPRCLLYRTAEKNANVLKYIERVRAMQESMST